MPKANSGSENPAEKAGEALGGMVQGESPPFPADNDTTDQANDIADIFGLGEEAGPVPNSSEGSPDGGASPSGAKPAADGSEGQANQPATPPASQQQPEQQGASQATAQPGEGQQASPAPAASPAASGTGQAQAPSSQEPSVQALQAQVQALIAQNAQLLERFQTQGAGSQAPQQGSSDQQGQQQVDPYMDYRFAIPDDVANAIFNEDPNVARQGLSHLINSLGRVVHERVIKSVTERVLPQTLGEFQGNLSLSTQQERMRTEYFGAFPQHKDPGTRLIVAQEAQAMWTQNPQLQWDQNAMNALGARVNQRLGYTSQQQQQPQPQQANGSAQGQPAPRPAAQMGASNRPPIPAGSDEDFIGNVLSAG